MSDKPDYNELLEYTKQLEKKVVTLVLFRQHEIMTFISIITVSEFPGSTHRMFVCEQCTTYW